MVFFFHLEIFSFSLTIKICFRLRKKRKKKTILTTIHQENPLTKNYKKTKIEIEIVAEVVVAVLQTMTIYRNFLFIIFKINFKCKFLTSLNFQINFSSIPKKPKRSREISPSPPPKKSRHRLEILFFLDRIIF